MNNLKASTLHDLAVYCGLPTASTKAAKIAAIDQHSKKFHRILKTSKSNISPSSGSMEPHINILSVDVGLKNFAYCKATYLQNAVQIHDWNVLNLHEAFNSAYSTRTSEKLENPDNLLKNNLLESNRSESNPSESNSFVNPSDPLDKSVLANLALSVVDNIFISDWTPHVIAIESQRTRSNNNSATLPNVLANLSLENMMYACFVARQSTTESIRSTSVMLMNSGKMANFWLNKFLLKKTNPKSARLKLICSWLETPACAPFDISSLIQLLPENFALLSPRAKTKAMKTLLKSTTTPKKLDDLVDSLLYNFAVAKQLHRHQQLLDCDQEQESISGLVEAWNQEHLQYLSQMETT